MCIILEVTRAFSRAHPTNAKTLRRIAPRNPGMTQRTTTPRARPTRRTTCTPRAPSLVRAMLEARRRDAPSSTQAMETTNTTNAPKQSNLATNAPTQSQDDSPVIQAESHAIQDGTPVIQDALPLNPHVDAPTIIHIDLTSSQTFTTMINPIEYISHVFDTLVAPTLTNSNHFTEQIQRVMYKKLVTDFVTTSIAVVPLTSFEQLIQVCTEAFVFANVTPIAT